jgi:hypothetical protein
VTETNPRGAAGESAGFQDREPGAGDSSGGLTIAATELGYYASFGFCSRCAWVRLHVKDLPFQGFPGIFSSIDRYNKLLVQNHFLREDRPPEWLAAIGDVREFVRPPHWSAFKAVDSQTGVTVRGEADAIFRCADGSYAIVDYKTTRYNPAYRSMFRAYRAQLNAYAYIGERLGLAPVSKLALVYMEPQTDEEAVLNPQLIDSGGFSMGFRATIVKVALKPDVLIPPLLRKVKEVSDMEKPPPAGPECKDCQAMDGLLQLLGD